MSEILDSHQTKLEEDDILWKQLKSVPAFRALLRSVEARFYQQTELPKPVLDLGCGDGHFASLTFEESLAVGIDPWWRPLKKARQSGAYDIPVQGLGDAMPFQDNYFGSIISNSVLEHIPDVQPVLAETARILKPGGKLVITFPNHRFTENLKGALWLERLGRHRLAGLYRRGFNTIARHAHTDPPDLWIQRLGDAGLDVESWQDYFSVAALHALEFGHLFGLPSALCHLLTRRWVIAPWRSSLYFTERWLRPHFSEPSLADGTMLLFVARKPDNNRISQTNSSLEL